MLIRQLSELGLPATKLGVMRSMQTPYTNERSFTQPSHTYLNSNWANQHHVLSVSFDQIRDHDVEKIEVRDKGIKKISATS